MWDFGHPSWLHDGRKLQTRESIHAIDTATNSVIILTVGRVGSWEDSYVSEQEVFGFKNGVPVSCEAEGCTSCSVCGDGISVAVNCSIGERWDLAEECRKGYTGSFANTFDFGPIGQLPAAAAAETAAKITSIMPVMNEVEGNTHEKLTAATETAAKTNSILPATNDLED